MLILALTILATVLCFRAFHEHYNRQLRNVVRGQLAEMFPAAAIYVEHAVQQQDGSVAISNLCLADKTSKRRLPIFAAQRVVLQGDLGIEDALSGQIQIKQVDLFGVQCDIWPLDENRWSVQLLETQPQSDTCAPKVELHDAIVRLRKSADPEAPVVAVHNLSGTVEQKWASDFSPTKVLQADLVGRSAGTVDNFQISARLVPSKNDWTVRGRFGDLLFSKSLLDRLPEQLSKYLRQAQGLECQASAEFELRSQPNQAPAFHLSGHVDAGRLQDPRLPYPFENLQGRFSFQNSQLQVRELQAESGSANLNLNMDLYGLKLTSPLVAVAEFDHLELDDRLYQSLPEKLKKSWDKLQLSGRVNGALKLVFDGHRWTPTMSADCEGVAIRPWLFPFPITDIWGHVDYRNHQITSRSLQGRAGGQSVFGNFALSKSPDAPDQWWGELTCRADGAVAIDEQLVRALTKRDEPVSGAEKFVRSLRPSGTIQLSQATFSRESLNDIWHKTIDASVYGGRIMYQSFVYPISDIRGQIKCDDDHWTLNQFEGRNGSGRINCTGAWAVGPNSVPFDLRFSAFAIPLVDELKRALPEETQFVWDELQPLGSIDQVQVRLLRRQDQPRVETLVKITERSRENSETGRSLRLKPKAFPYWLTDIDCEIDYSPGNVVIRNASGINGASRIAMRGTCKPTSDGRWKASVEWLPQTRLVVESELLKALPKSIRESLVRIEFRGPISILGRSEMLFTGAKSDRVESAWDCQMSVEDGQLGDGRYIGALRGTMWMRGRSDGVKLEANGEIAMDALTVLGIPVTRLKGPFALVGSTLFFGQSVFENLPQLKTDASKELAAQALGGRVSLSGHGRLDSGNFFLDSNLQAADLNLLLRDLGVKDATAEATCDAKLHFTGVPWDPNTYNGFGEAHLTDAQLYELPFMIRLMSVASVTAKSDSAFQTADISFRLDGDHIPLTVNCDGDILRLYGEGWTNLRKEVHLPLWTYVGRRSLIRGLMQDSRYASLALIEVNGTLDNPTMKSEPFPQIEATLEQIFPELANAPETPRLPWSRR